MNRGRRNPLCKSIKWILPKRPEMLRPGLQPHACVPSPSRTRWAGGRACAVSPGVPSTPLKHAFDLFSKDKERQKYKNPFLLLSKFHVGQGERGKEKIEKKESCCHYFSSNKTYFHLRTRVKTV